MEKVPEDVLVHIFREYLRGGSVMPTSITLVCREWYNLLRLTPSLWSKVFIHLVSTFTVPSLLSSAGLETYLSRSDGTDIPLDITIRWDASEHPVRDHDALCDLPWFEGVRCGRGPCGYESVVKSQLAALFARLAGTPLANENNSEGVGVDVTTSPERLKRWKTLTLNFETQMKTMCVELSFEPFENPKYKAPNLTTLTFEGVAGCSPGPHPQFAPNLRTISLTDAVCIEFPDLTHLHTLTIMKKPGYVPSGRTWIDVPNLKYLEISLPEFDVTSGRFPSLKLLSIYRSIGDILLSDLEKGAAGKNGPKPLRLGMLSLGDISPHVLVKMSKGIYATNAEKIIFSTSPVTKSNRDFIFHGYTRKKFVAALAIFMWHCADDTEFIPMGESAAQLLAEARRRNEED